MKVRIDIGDGAGVQVFEAETETELIAKLVIAQENATRKIRDLNRRLRAVIQMRRASR